MDDIMWSNLPELAILAIAKNLKEVPDLLAFSHVNSRFRKAIGRSGLIWTEFVEKLPLKASPRLLKLANELQAEFPNSCEAKLIYLVLRKTSLNLQTGQARKVEEVSVSGKLRSFQYLEDFATISTPDFGGIVWTSATIPRFLNLNLWRFDHLLALSKSIYLEGDDAHIGVIDCVEVFGNIVIAGLGFPK